MEQQQSVWEQIEEDKEDYQYFKQQNDKQLLKTLEAYKKLGIDKNDET